MAQSPFQQLTMAPYPEAFHKHVLWTKSTNPNKVDLSVGAYRNGEGQPWILPVVAKVERQLLNDSTYNHEYLTMEGYTQFREAALKFVFGSSHRVFSEERVFGIQAVGGNGCLTLAAVFLATKLKYKDIAIPTPTYSNHPHLFPTAGLTVSKYRYLDKSTMDLDFDGMLADIMALPDNSVILLQVAAHNPSGVDPNKEQWKQILQVCKEKSLMVLFDNAYQGFATGDVDEDAWPVRYFADSGLNMMVATTFSKNFGLYDGRAGLLAVVASEPGYITLINSQIVATVRGLWSLSPGTGAKIVSTILSTPEYYEEWLAQLKSMVDRIREMRQALLGALKELGTPGNWDFMGKQIGMFSFTGFTSKQIDYLVSQAVFMTSDGRLSIPGLNTTNVHYVAKCIDEAVRNY